MNRRARMMALTLALLCLFTIGAGAAVASMMPKRLELFKLPVVSARDPAPAGTALRQVTRSPSGGVATAAGVKASLDGLIKSGLLGPQVGALVTELSTGQVLYSKKAGIGFTPASTTKIATAIAALDTLGPDARFVTKVVLSGRGGAGSGGTAPGLGGGSAGTSIVLVGGGDPTLAASRYPAGDYPQPATLQALALATARALRARGIRSVRLHYYDSMFSGPTVARGWPAIGAPGNYVSSGNFTPITGLEVDQGRLTAHGAPDDADNPGNFLARSLTPSTDAANAFAHFLGGDGITLRGRPSPGPLPRSVQPGVSQRPGRGARAGKLLAQVRSPTLAEIVQQMLTESNNVIAETLARQVALATGRPGTFAGSAAAVTAVAGKLGVTGLHLFDGSGLSPKDRISPRALVTLVGLAAKTGPHSLRPAITGMPVAGFSGTLGPGSSFGPFGRAALGTVRAKTGNLTHVATMAGIAYTEDGQVLTFAFMGNGIPAGQAGIPMSALAKLATALAGCGCG